MLCAAPVRTRAAPRPTRQTPQGSSACGRVCSRVLSPSRVAVLALCSISLVLPERSLFFISYSFKLTGFAKFCKHFVFSLCIFYSLEPCRM